MSWPTTLPQSPSYNNYTETPRTTTLRFDPDLGASKERNRFTAVPSDVTENYILTKDQVDILESFFINDCNRGPTTFLKPHAWRNVTKNYKFKQPPQVDPVGGTLYSVTIELEMSP